MTMSESASYVHVDWSTWKPAAHVGDGADGVNGIDDTVYWSHLHARIDDLEAAVARLENNIVALSARLDAIGVIHE